MLSVLYKVETNTINYHIKKIYNDNELNEDSTIRKFRIVQKEGNRKVSRDVVHYNLQMIIALGFKVDNERAAQFRKLVNEIVKEYTIKGFAMDDEKLKNSGSILTEKYFDELLERIREIRLSERRFYQKVTDIYATSIDYDRNSKTTLEFLETWEAIYNHNFNSVEFDGFRKSAGFHTFTLSVTEWCEKTNAIVIYS